MALIRKTKYVPSGGHFASDPYSGVSRMNMSANFQSIGVNNMLVNDMQICCGSHSNTQYL